MPSGPLNPPCVFLRAYSPEFRQLLDEACDIAVAQDDAMLRSDVKSECDLAEASGAEEFKRLLEESCDAMVAVDDVPPELDESEFKRLLEETCGALRSADECMADVESDPGSPPPPTDGWFDDIVNADSDAGAPTPSGTASGNAGTRPIRSHPTSPTRPQSGSGLLP